MLVVTTCLAWALAAQTPTATVVVGHDANPVLAELMGGKLVMEATPIPLPPPSFVDGASAREQAAVLKKVAGSPAKAEEMLRDSLTAPHILLPPHDSPTKGGGIARFVDLWFAIHANLDALDPSKLGVETGPVEAGNMKFETQKLDAAALEARDLKVTPRDEWYSHQTGRLLDRVRVDSTDRLSASKSAESWVVASRTSSEFDRDREYPNIWRRLFRNAEGTPNAVGPPFLYAGGAGYVKVTRLKDQPATLMVEVHAAYIEPREWFEGAPILRSKVGLAAEDRIRKLRRELAGAKGDAKTPPSAGLDSGEATKP